MPSALQNNLVYEKPFYNRLNGAETLDIVAKESGSSRYINQSIDKEESVELDPNNLVSSKAEHRIHDGQKRYKTLGKTTSSKYPRPKTLFYVGFENNLIDGNLSKEISKYVLSVSKPNVLYTTKKMNQYNRIKYVYENVSYGDLKITFIDVKDNPIEQAFFQYLRYNNYDFSGSFGINDLVDDTKYKTYTDYKYEDSDWGLNINSNDKMFNSITIYEMFLNSIMVYKIENPVLKDINFGENKMGEYGYNEITVTFQVEGITNILDMKNINGNEREIYNVIGEQITKVGGKDLANYLGMRWYEGLGECAIDPMDFDLRHNYNYYRYNTYNQKNISNEKIQNANNKLQLERAERQQIDYSNYSNKSRYYWISDGIGTENDYSNIGKLFAPRSKQLIDYFGF